MKFTISLIFSLSVNASPIHLLHESNLEDANIYRDILITIYQIPEDLIKMKAVDACEVQKPEGKLDMCLKNNGDLKLVSADQEFIGESLKVFRSP